MPKEYAPGTRGIIKPDYDFSHGWANQGIFEKLRDERVVGIYLGKQKGWCFNSAYSFPGYPTDEFYTSADFTIPARRTVIIL